MNAMQAVTDLAAYLSNGQANRVFKYEKLTGYKGNYIAVNSLPFVYGTADNTSNVLNVNVHASNLAKGLADLITLQQMCNEVEQLINKEGATEDKEETSIKGNIYTIESISNVMPDTDNTHFVNIRIRIKFNEL